MTSAGSVGPREVPTPKNPEKSPQTKPTENPVRKLTSKMMRKELRDFSRVHNQEGDTEVTIIPLVGIGNSADSKVTIIFRNTSSIMQNVPTEEKKKLRKEIQRMTGECIVGNIQDFFRTK